MNLYRELAKILDVDESLISYCPKPEMGDLSLPCFVLAKKEGVAPAEIMPRYAERALESELVADVKPMGAYLNFFINKNYLTKAVLNELKEVKFPNIGENKVVCIDYCSVNLAKYLHIGHFTTTIIGESLARICEALGYKVVRINYVGDYGTPFGKMVVAYKLWGNKEEIEERGMDAIQDLYVKFCANENEELLEKARYASSQIEKKSGTEYEIYKWIIDITIEETKRLISRMGISFDDWRGESTYNDKMEEPLEEIRLAGLSKVENGATIIGMNEYNLGVCVLKRSDGASLYVTRDLAAVEDRYNRYHFDEMLYVTASQQNSHFAKLFKVCELLNKPYADKLHHIAYGMFSLPEGKIASRKGKQALFQDILDEAENEAYEVVKNRNLSEEKKDKIVKNVALSAISFSILKVDRIKDKVFDLKKAVSFDGETGPYIQYTYARCNSLIKKYLEKYDFNDEIMPNFQNSAAGFALIKLLADRDEIILTAKERYEPSLISRYLLDICQIFNTYYNETRIVTDDEQESASKINFVRTIKNVLEADMKLVCINPIDEM